MSVWNKKGLLKTEVEELQKKYKTDPITASIMLRRNVTSGKDILYYLEDDLRFQHSPFCFNNMEDVVDRILDAKEENEKILIFGDRDVDGVSSTTILYDCLSSMGLDVTYRLPSGNDQYGLSMQAVDDFAKDFGSLIITVDCGISNYEEIDHAVMQGIDVIVLDHHTPPEVLPEAILIDPKLKDSGYPFQDISGAAVAYKVVSALRFSQSRWYKEDITLLNVRPMNECYKIECVKIRNLVPVSRLEETIVPGTVSISQTRLPSYLQNQLIMVWDLDITKKLLTNAFGSNIDFNLMDMRPEIGKVIPSVSQLSLLRVKDMSTIAKYGDHPATEIGGFYNIFVSYVQQMLKKEFPQHYVQEEKDMQLVALAALADIMPMKNENRIFVKKALSIMNSGKIRDGLRELLSNLNLLGKRLNSTKLSWDVVSNLNAAGRLGHPELAAQLFLSKNPIERQETSQKIIALNAERKKLSQEAADYGMIQAETSLSVYNNLCVVIDERINRGVCGILAGRLVSQFNVPCAVVTIVDGIAVGSMRSCRGHNLPSFLEQMKDIFLNFGGHNYAAGFSFEASKLDEFKERLQVLSRAIELTEDKSDYFEVDAEIPESYMTPSLLELEDKFEPFGEENGELILMSKKLKIADAFLMGKSEKTHLKLILQAGNYKWPCLFWNEGERLHRDFEIGDKVDILFHAERNTFNGIESPQLILLDISKSVV